MSTPKIVLFYAFTALPDPEAIRLWQQAICESLGLRGRIILSRHGINATVGGDLAAVKRYVRATRGYPPFADVDVKWSAGTGADFPRLSVRVRPEIVTFGTPEELEVDDAGVIGGGRRLDPHDLHRLVDERGEDVVFFDGRNRIESAIGRFAGAITPDAETTRDFVPLLDSGAYDHLKNRPVVTYCTGGVRCEVLTALMRNRGFEEVYQLDGGIARYGEEFGDDGLWEGSLYVFDKRMTVEFSDRARVIATCAQCGDPTSNVSNHPDRLDRELTVICDHCLTASGAAPESGERSASVRPR
ncbi:rhodanese-related sulfurtransferase [Gordonia sp. DT30]|uniref:oxygen-dependent tRNA uridine(34) hydroxylase TrhO n=1 Tax=unclassified Gordonia (in: high G+C Gram-positive bacteria) TaxID=2657482 RepID=UPI003CEFB95A